MATVCRGFIDSCVYWVKNKLLYTISIIVCYNEEGHVKQPIELYSVNGVSLQQVL